ncbi:MAG: NAD-dependent epimerase/dehydratase family protein [Bacteroidota bacterium]
MSYSLLITGGCGFVGSGLALLFKNHYPQYRVIAFDNLKRRGSELNIQRLRLAGIEFIHGDIRNREDLDTVGKIDFMIEAAAEPSVMAGISSAPDYLLNTNLFGALNCMEFCRKHGAGLMFLSTSRIYPIGTIEAVNFTETDTRFEISDDQSIAGASSKGFSEAFPLDGARSLYGATKLASEIMLHEYIDTYKLPAVINRCGVLTGPWQMGKVDQGVTVLWVARHFWKNKLGYFGYGGTGKQVRDILHINDLFRLVEIQMGNIEKYSGKIFNAGGGREVSVSLQELTAVCEEVTGNKIEITQVPENRAADIRVYITDNTKVTAETGWKPEIGVKQIITDIHDWISANESQLKPILN